MAAWANRAGGTRVRLGVDLRPLLLFVRSLRCRSAADRLTGAHDRARRAGGGDGAAPPRRARRWARRSAIRRTSRRWPRRSISISGGRLDLGIGAGWLEQEFVGVRVSVRHRRRTVRGVGGDAPGAARRCSPARRRRSTDRRSRSAMPGSCPAPVQEPRIPVWVGGKGGPRLLRLAARHADGWNAVWRWAPEAYAERVAAARQICEQEGRDPATFRLSVGLSCLLGEDEAAASGGVRAGASIDAGRCDGLRDRGVVARRHALGHARAGTRAAPTRSRRSASRRSSIAPWVLPFAVPEPEQVELFAERVMGPFRAGA